MPKHREGNTTTEPVASKGIGLAVAGIIVAYFATLPFITVVVLYLFMTIYAIVRAIGPGAGENAVAIVVGFVLLTSLLVVLIGVTVHFVGRSLTPKRVRGRH